MNDGMMMSGGMMWGMGLVWLLVMAVLVLGAAALVKYLLSRPRNDHPGRHIGDSR